MSYRVLMWTLAALVLVAGVTAFDLYRERRDGGAAFIASNGPVSQDQVRKINDCGWLEQHPDNA